MRRLLSNLLSGVLRKLLPPTADSIQVGSVRLQRAESPQQHREKLARIILDEMYQFVALLDTQGILLEVNRAALEGGGIQLEDILGKPFWETHWWTISKATQLELQDAIRRAADGEFIRYDVEVYGGAGGSETIIADFSIIPVKDQTGQVVFLLPEGRNITEKKRVEAEVARKNQELKELDEIKSQFFANVSHELRTPLTLILGPVEQILAGTEPLAGSQRRALETVRRNASTLLKHVNDLLDVAKLEATKMVTNYARVDLATLVRVVAAHFDAIARQKQITFDVQTPAQLPAEADPEKLERVVLNLLSNAFKFTPDGGRIKVEVSALEGDRARITVQDSGSGVPEHLRKAIFQRFRQGEGGSTRRFGGTGLGLAIVKEFVELHGGTLGVLSAPAGGALFWFEIPLRAAEGAQVSDSALPAVLHIEPIVKGTLDELKPVTPEAAASEAQQALRAERPLVLVVEDHPEMNRFIAECLSRDYRVATAFDGQEGLEKALELRPDLIISDIMMPRMSGDQLLAELRKRSELSQVPVLILSAKADEPLRVTLLKQGAQDYVIKPFAADELLVRARNLVTLKRLTDGLAGRLQRTNELLREALNARDEFISLASHELRTPITSLSLHTQLLERAIKERRNVDPEYFAKTLDTYHSQLRRLTALVESMLDLSRISSGRFELVKQEVDLGELAKEVIERFSEQLKEAGCAIDLRAEPGVIGRWDSSRLDQAITNLLSNASKYAPGKPIVVEVTQSGGRACLSVSDSGPGIPKDVQERIFERFERATSSISIGGLGLGLYLTKRILEQHGGGIGVESEVGRGSTFKLELPL